jgi:hypothetical protein
MASTGHRAGTAAATALRARCSACHSTSLTAAAAAVSVAAAPCKLSLRHKMAHMTATGAVRVACRGLSGCAGGLRRSMEDQALPRRGYATSLSKRASGASTPPGGSVASFGGSGSFGQAAEAAVAEAAADGAVAATDGEQ